MFVGEHRPRFGWNRLQLMRFIVGNGLVYDTEYYKEWFKFDCNFNWRQTHHGDVGSISPHAVGSYTEAPSVCCVKLWAYEARLKTTVYLYIFGDTNVPSCSSQLATFNCTPWSHTGSTKSRLKAGTFVMNTACVVYQVRRTLQKGEMFILTQSCWECSCKYMLWCRTGRVALRTWFFWLFRHQSIYWIIPT